MIRIKHLHFYSMLYFAFRSQIYVRRPTQKVESIFGVRKFGQTMESFQTISQPAVFISDITNVLPKILEHFNQMAGNENK